MAVESYLKSSGRVGREWSKEETINFMQLLKDKPALWNTKSSDYKDHNIKRECLTELAQCFDCTADDVEKKIATVRFQFVREHAKVLNSKNNYEPKWYGYRLLHFLSDVTLKTGNKSVPKKNKLKSNWNDSTSSDDEDCYETGKFRDKPIEMNEQEVIPKSKRIRPSVSYEPPFSTVKPDTYQYPDYQVPVQYYQVEPSVPLEPRIQQQQQQQQRERETPIQTEPPRSELRIQPPEPRPQPRLRPETRTPAPRIRMAPESTSEELTAFGEYVVASIKNIPDRYYQSLARRRISEVLFQVETQVYRHNPVQTDQFQSVNHQSTSTHPHHQFDQQSDHQSVHTVDDHAPSIPTGAVFIKDEISDN